VILLVSLVPCSEATAKDLGVRGELFPVIEPDIQAAIMSTLNRFEEEGRMKALQDELVDRTKGYVQRPKPVNGVTRANQDRSWLHDPSIQLQHDLQDARGVVFARAGQRVNPLQHLPFDQTLLFIDGDDKQQIAWADAEAGKVQRSKIILVRGPVYELSRQRGKQLYFDQEGTLTAVLGIAAVPAKVRREGNLLRISEVALR
jgi:conjugal transfer pilus assembly protein TraW